MARASAFQAEGRGFESRFPLHILRENAPGRTQGRPQRVAVDRISAHVAQSVEHILGKDEVTSSILVVGSISARVEQEMRNNITLACTECKRRNYTTTKNKRTMQDRLEMKKFCKFCKTHTPHKETK